MRDAIRPWCAEAEFPGLKPFLGGTITLPATARHDEIIAALEAHFRTFLPPGFSIVRPVCGALFFVENENA